ncbi:MAG: hypothetical protein LBK58_09635 [Prevotellaceae bacterium]|jgi:hypothetical protein|nr:hypothetical protein [Prevotellaceae bacterium]
MKKKIICVLGTFLFSASISAQDYTSPASFKLYLEQREEPMTWAILILSVILFFMRISRTKGRPVSDGNYGVFNTLFLAVSGIEILYFFGSGSIWFCTPDRVGWLWTVINFILLCGVVYNQVYCYISILEDIPARNNVECDYSLGWLSAVGGVILGFIFALFFKAGHLYLFAIVVLLQIVQIIMIFKCYGRDKRKGAWFCSFAYLLGTFGSILTASVLIALLIIIAVGIGILWICSKAFGWGDSGSGETPKVRGYYSDGTSEEMEYQGKGITGEKYYKGKDTGNTYVDP